MNNATGDGMAHDEEKSIAMAGPDRLSQLPAAWQEFIRFCGELKYGEIERLSIQDGVPVIAEVIRKKVKFNRER